MIEVERPIVDNGSTIGLTFYQLYITCILAPNRLEIGNLFHEHLLHDCLLIYVGILFIALSFTYTSLTYHYN